MKIIRRWYEDMKLLHLSLLRSGENLQSAVSLLQSFSICVCSVTEGCSTRSLGLYLYNAAGDIIVSVFLFACLNTLIFRIIDIMTIRANVINTLLGLM